MASLDDVLLSVRELAFDRFVTPTFFLKGSEGDQVKLTSSALQILDAESNLLLDLPFTTYPSLHALTSELVSQGYKVAYSASFVGTEPSTSLQPKQVSITEIACLYRTFFFSDDWMIKNVVQDYALGMMKLDPTQLGEDLYTTFSEAFAKLKNPWQNHAALWMAYHIVGRRRLYELAAKTMDRSAGFDEEDAGLMTTMESSSQISLSIADVFSISEGPETNDITEKLDAVGVDNVLGDKNDFWYRLQLWLRERLEYLFSDFSLRKNQVIQGTIQREQITNFYAYFDNYPYTISPVSREILRRG